MSEKLSIAFIALGFPPDVGGTELYNIEYARRLHERGHDLRVLTWDTDSPGMAEIDASLPFEIRRFPFQRVRKKLSAVGIAETLTEWQSQVAFISRGSRMLPNVVSCVARKLPVVLSIHEFREKHRGRGLFQRWRVRRRYGLHKAKVVTVNSADTRARMIDLGIPEQNLVTVYPGVDVQRFQPNKDEGATLRKDQGWGTRPIMLTVSRLAANKGHASILESLPKLIPEFPELLYVIVGKGGMREELEKLSTDLGISDHVHFTGLVKDPRPYYQACDVFCMASNPQNEGANAGEGFGIAYVEAGACGKPVLASSSGGGAEIVIDGETGRVIDPRIPEQLHEALQELLKSSETRARMGEAGRKRVQQYDWNNGVLTLEGALYKSLQ